MMRERGEHGPFVSFRRLAYAAQRLEHAFPALCPARVPLSHILLGPRPWPRSASRLKRLRRRFPGFVRRLHGCHGGVRLLPSVRHWLAASAFPTRPMSLGTRAERRPPGFRAKSVVACMGSLTTPSRFTGSPWRPRPCCLPGLPTRPALGSPLSRLNTQPATPLANASPMTSRSAAHDTGPVRLARPSPYGTCIHYSLPAFRRTGNRSNIISITQWYDRDRPAATHGPLA